MHTVLDRSVDISDTKLQVSLDSFPEREALFAHLALLSEKTEELTSTIKHDRIYPLLDELSQGIAHNHRTLTLIHEALKGRRESGNASGIAESGNTLEKTDGAGASPVYAHL